MMRQWRPVLLLSLVHRSASYAKYSNIFWYAKIFCEIIILNKYCMPNTFAYISSMPILKIQFGIQYFFSYAKIESVKLAYLFFIRMPN